MANPNSNTSRSERHGSMTDAQVEQGVGNLLRIGVLLSAAVTLIGGTLYLVENAWSLTQYTEFRGVNSGLNSIIGILHGVAQFDSRAIIQLGIVLLIATPAARVALSLLDFIRQRDRTYVFITAIVLCLLLLGLTGKISTH